MEAPAAYGPIGSSSLWEEINDSPVWLHVLAALYGLVAVVAFVQVVRIQSRTPEYGWTTQKVFHLLISLVHAARSVIFGLSRYAQKLEPPVLLHILLDIPTLVFFTTFAILLHFWTSIYYQAKALSIDPLKPGYYIINAVVYAAQIALWFAFWQKPLRSLIIVLNLFIAVVSLFAAFGFLFYGRSLFLMLRRFPIESRGKKKKIREVGWISSVSISAFLLRCITMCLSAAIKAADLYDLHHSVVIFVHFLLVEILPSLSVLVFLRKLPDKKKTFHEVELAS